MKKILVIGSSGAGKSVFSRRLSDILGIEVIHLDRLYWKPNWVESSHDDFDQVLDTILAGDEWIIDGNYGRTMERRIAAADTVIFLDLSRFVCTVRVLKRFVSYRNRNRPDMAEGCNEKVDWGFLRFTWNYPSRSRDKVLRRLNDVRKNKSIFVLGSAKEVGLFLRDVDKHKNLEFVSFGKWK